MVKFSPVVEWTGFQILYYTKTYYPKNWGFDLVSGHDLKIWTFLVFKHPVLGSLVYFYQLYKNHTEIIKIWRTLKYLWYLLMPLSKQYYKNYLLAGHVYFAIKSFVKILLKTWDAKSSEPGTVALMYSDKWFRFSFRTNSCSKSEWLVRGKLCRIWSFLTMLLRNDDLGQ